MEIEKPTDMAIVREWAHVRDEYDLLCAEKARLDEKLEKLEERYHAASRRAMQIVQTGPEIARSFVVWDKHLVTLIRNQSVPIVSRFER